MSFNTALSGIKAATNDLNIVSNNVANASTAGFKASRAEFSDVYAASALGAGSNAIGTGVSLASVTQQFTQGTISFTSNNLDLAVSGSGFFRLNSSGSTTYSRDGSFTVDRNGFIVNNGSSRLTGFLADSTGNITGATGDLQIDSSNLPPSGTTTATVGVNLSATDVPPAGAWVGSPNFGDPPPAANTYNNATSTTIYDSLGNSHLMSVYFIKTATPNQWESRVQVDGIDVDSAPTTTPFTQVFNADGSYNSGASEAVNISWAPLDPAGNPNGATTPQAFAIGLSTSTQFGSPFAVQSLSQNGFTTGRLDGLDIDSSGVVFGRYTNGQARAMGQVTLANFQNPNGLQPLGDTAWTETFSSGSALVGTPGTASLGVIQSGALEDSNVDITEQLVKMIIAQRNFQANAQVIGTNDTVTQTIINLR